MAFCAKCGAQLNEGSGFCGACGAPVAGQSVTTSSGAAAAPAQAGTASTGMTNNVAAMLAYVPFGIGLILSIVFLVIEPYNKNRFVRFNAFQSIFLHVGVFVLWIAFFFLSMILGFITRGLSIFMMGPLMFVVWLGVLVTLVLLMIKAYGNQEMKLPIIGEMAAKQAGA
ncbi:MAG TPA: zinc-ribbon domain-containing protein [Candidatus Angelobacter sp.]|nr:zinc-ribbon domain-containing protein [Candidatus Angelobacter sp.]